MNALVQASLCFLTILGCSGATCLTPSPCNTSLHKSPHKNCNVQPVAEEHPSPPPHPCTSPPPNPPRSIPPMMFCAESRKSSRRQNLPSSQNVLNCSNSLHIIAALPLCGIRLFNLFFSNALKKKSSGG